MSYNGKLDFGLLGDYDAMPDIEEFADHLAASLDELVQAARQANPPAKAKPKKRSDNGKPAKSRKKPASA